LKEVPQDAVEVIDRLEMRLGVVGVAGVKSCAGRVCPAAAVRRVGSVAAALLWSVPVVVFARPRTPCPYVYVRISTYYALQHRGEILREWVPETRRLSTPE